MRKLYFGISFFLLIFSIGISIPNEDLQIFQIANFKRGLNTDIATDMLPNGASPELNNIILDETEGLTKRKGLKLIYTLPVPTDTKILSSFVAEYEDGDSQFIVHVGSQVMYSDGSNIWRTIYSAVSKNFPMRFAMFRNKVWMTNGTDKVAVWDRNCLKTYSFIPRGQFILVDKEQVLIAGIVSDPSTVRF